MEVDGSITLSPVFENKKAEACPTTSSASTLSHNNLTEKETIAIE
jgi:hypothetical protein